MKAKLQFFALSSLGALLCATSLHAAPLDTNRIEQLTGLQGAWNVAQFNKNKPILVNCHAGSRWAIAAAELARLGFKNVFNLDGGLDAWERAGHHPEK